MLLHFEPEAAGKSLSLMTAVEALPVLEFACVNFG